MQDIRSRFYAMIFVGQRNEQDEPVETAATAALIVVAIYSARALKPSGRGG